MTAPTFREPKPPVVAAPYWTEERAAVQAEARRFATEEILPVADELDPQKAEIPRSLLERLAKQGYFGITVSTELGGMGLGVFEYCMISEELARAWMSTASIIVRAQGAMGVNVADPQRRRALIERSAQGEWIGAAALSEPDVGSDLAAVRTRAVLDGDEYVITGEKRWCGNALAADFIQVFCRLADPEPGQSRAVGLGSILVEKERGSFPEGLTGTPIDKIGYHGFVTWNLTFDGLRVPAANRVYPKPAGDLTPLTETEAVSTAGFKAVEAELNTARVQTAARAVGLARGAVEDSLAYLQRREQFGRPIADFQYLRFLIAEMAARVEQARAFYQQVAHMIDAGLPCEREAAMAKLTASEMAAEVTAQAIQLHGGNGYTTEHRAERYWRDARLTTIFEGTSEIQRKIIADRLLPKSPLG
ncbi:acyl-CoA dehydrogenase family protein [Streptomyces ochraceiscleroticus]|uniref:Acyl-CoA dehydrogenase family protein n=1 Tax=Streptomyces ochraceiscleroticus TaxID=47761 RepID=A0ABW1MJT0_9ACTN|nr:acyl-CoA dehydrogenase family protein [Streptomyces ochraceiscleroticus]